MYLKREDTENKNSGIGGFLRHTNLHILLLKISSRMDGLRETLEDGGAYNNASSNINTGSSNHIEEIIQSSWNKFSESIDLLHSSMAQHLEKVQGEFRSLRSTLEDVSTLNEIDGERKVTEDSKIRSSDVFNAECKSNKNLERGTTPENASSQTRSDNPYDENPIVTRSSVHCERAEKKYNAQKQDHESGNHVNMDVRNRRCEGAKFVRRPMSIKGCSEEIYGGRGKVLRNRRTIEDFTVDTACGRDQGLNEDDTDLSVDTDYYIVRTDDGDKSRKSVQRNSSDTGGSAIEMSTESELLVGELTSSRELTNSPLNIEDRDSQSCEKNLCSTTDLFEDRAKVCSLRSGKCRDAASDNISEMVDRELQKKLQRADKQISLIIKWKEQDQKPEWSAIAKYGVELKFYWKIYESLALVDGVLYRLLEDEKGKSVTKHIVVPSELGKFVFTKLHKILTKGHFGVLRTVQDIRTRYFWYGLNRDVKMFSQTCDICSSKMIDKEHYAI